MVRYVRRRCGLLHLDDLAAYAPTILESPMQKPYGRFTVVGSPTMGSPSVIQALYLYDQIVRTDAARPRARDPTTTPWPGPKRSTSPSGTATVT